MNTGINANTNVNTHAKTYANTYTNMTSTRRTIKTFKKNVTVFHRSE